MCGLRGVGGGGCGWEGGRCGRCGGGEVHALEGETDVDEGGEGLARVSVLGDFEEVLEAGLVVGVPGGEVELVGGPGGGRGACWAEGGLG